ncbi:hypothetical protein H5410_030210 [Solanum commersonii]|uniref:Uncharacterized protein n=1 Tax=Solanum commersonii TaxID=4109 RepID=A0A9J5YGT1_SOLCO|nr:hypothetical protein H5410_030210 [Solanum commersonii]
MYISSHTKGLSRKNNQTSRSGLSTLLDVFIKFASPLHKHHHFKYFYGSIQSLICEVDHATSSCSPELGHTTPKSLSRQSQNYRTRDINCDSSPSFNLEKYALSVVLAKAGKKSCVVLHQGHNSKRRCSTLQL